MDNSGNSNSGNLSYAPPPAQPRPIHFEWRKWIAENVALEREPAFIIAHMVKSGFDQETATREVREALAHPYVAAVRKVMSSFAPSKDNQAEYKLKKRDWVLKCLLLNAQQSPRFGKIDRVRKPSRQQFIDDYYALSRPVVIEGAMEDWDLDSWTLENLKQRFGTQIVEVQANRSADSQYERNAAKLKTQMPFGQFVDIVKTAGESNNYYMTGGNSGRNWEAFRELWEQLPLLTEYLVKDPNNPGFLWIGPAGTVTPLHHDMTNGLLAQLRGRKLFRMVSPLEIASVYNDNHCFSQVDIDRPDPQRFPLFKDVTIHETVLNPGELLLVPVSWWHYVRALDESIMITFNNFPVRNEFGTFYSTY